MDKPDIKIFRSFGNAAERPKFRTVQLPYNKSWTLRDYQVPVFGKLRNQLFTILRCPTGWGKTRLLQFLAGDYLTTHTDWKVVICVPQHIIAPGFTNRIALNLDDQTVKWGTIYDLCGRDTDKKIKKLKRFLSSSPGSTLESRVLITTHSCLTRFWDTFGSDSLLQKTLFIADECHHSQSDDEKMEAVMMNRLGRFVHYVLKSKEQTGLWLATATFGRGDKLDIVPSSELKRFVQVSIPFDEYWRTMNYLQTFQNLYVVYGQSPLPAFGEIVKNGKRTLVFCPKAGSRFLSGHSKDAFVMSILEMLIQEKPGSYLWQPGDTKPNSILDLTVDQNRREKIKYIANHGDDVFAVMAVDMMKEGADWPALDQIIDFSPLSTSTRERIQKFGRGTRDYPGKSHFSYYSMLPMMKGGNEEKMRSTLSEMFGQLVLGMVESAYFCPVVEWKVNSGGRRGQLGRNILSRFSENQQERILKAAQERLLHLAASQEQLRFVITTQQIIDTIEETLMDLDIDNEERIELAEQIYLYIGREQRLESMEHVSSPISVVESGFDKVSVANVMDGALSFSSCIGDDKTFSEIRKVMGLEDDAGFYAQVDSIRSLNDSRVFDKPYEAV